MDTPSLDTVQALQAELTVLRARVAELEARLAEHTAVSEGDELSTSEFAVIFRATSDLIFVLDADGHHLKVVVTNPSRLYVPPSEQLGKTLHEIFPKRLADEMLDAIRKALSTHDAVELEYTLPIAGEVRWFLATISPLTETTVVWVTHDISERKQAELLLARERELLYTLLESFPDAIYQKDTLGRFIFINSTQARNLGIRDKSAAIGKTDFDFFTAEHSQESRAEENQVIASGEPMLDHVEHYLDPSGRAVYLSSTKVPLRDQDGNIYGIVGITRDITERYPAEEKLRRQEAELRLIIDSLPAQIWYKDTQNNVIRANKAAAEFIGLSGDDVVNIPTADIFPDYAQQYYQTDLQIIRTGQAVTGMVEEIISAAGEIYWIQKDKVPIFDHEGKVSGILVIETDITQLKRAEEALRESEERYRSLFENSVDGVYRSTSDGHFVDVNPAFVRMLGYDSAAEVLALQIAEEVYAYPEDRARLQAEYETVPYTSNVEVWLKKKDGTRILVNLAARAVRDPQGHIRFYEGTARDITERRQIEDQILRQNRQLLALQSAGAAVGASLDVNHVLNTVAYEMSNLLGVEHCAISEWNQVEDYVKAIARYSVETGWLLPKDMAEHFRLVDYPVTKATLVDQMVRQHTLSQADLHPSERRYLTSSGGITALMLPLVFHGQTVGLVELEDSRAERIFTDEEIALAQLLANQAAIAIENARLYAQAQQEIAERARIEAALRQSEERYRILIEFSPEATVMYDLQMEPTYINPAFERIFGWTLEEFKGNVPYVPPDYLESNPALTARILREGVLHEHEVHRMTKDGRRLDVLLSASVYRDVAGSPRGVIVILRNVTELKQAREQALALALERERVNLMASFVRDASHDFRTPLSTINTSLYLLNRTDDSERRTHHLNVLQQQAEHLERLVDGLFTMSRLDSSPELIQRARVSLEEILHDLKAKIEPVAQKKGLSVVFTAQTEFPFLHADRVELHRALMNLLDNAVRYSAQGTISVTVWKDSMHAFIDIDDEGIGIAPGDLPHIFDRFFRADKARSADTGGLGLGLSIAKKIVEAHGGNIQVHSIPNQGSTFTVMLPLADS